jgi:hypothetical protein
MCDLKWVTMGFARNYLQSVYRDDLLSENERHLLLVKGYRIIDKLKEAKLNEEVEDLHEALHKLLNELQGRRLSAFLRMRAET